MSNWRSTLRALSSPRSMGMDLERRHVAHRSEGADGEGHDAVMALEAQIAELLMDEPLGRGLAAREVCAVYFLVPVAHERVVLMVTEYLGGNRDGGSGKGCVAACLRGNVATERAQAGLGGGDRTEKHRGG